VILTALLQGFSILAATLIASVAGTFATSAPSASFSASTANPAAGVLVQFTDTSGGAPTAWAWDFGDARTSSDHNPTHVYAAEGSFTVRLTASNASGAASATLAVTVTSATVLRLNGTHTFDLTLSARDPRTGNSGVGTVIGQNDVYGYFSLPTLSGNPGNPELIVKMVDATGIGQNYWVFYGTMTDLEYSLSVKENPTGVVKVYSKDPRNPSGQFDTSGFLPTATPTQTPIATQTPVATPTPTGPTIVALTAKQFQWDFNAARASPPTSGRRMSSRSETSTAPGATRTGSRESPSSASRA
jgi:PKD repeat protein